MQKLVAKTHKITTEIVTVTPEIAQAWLDKNTNNRKAAIGTVKKYMRDMTSGNWRLTGDAIRFNRDGTLIDGQHRLMACKSSGVSFETIVMYGLDNETQDVLDTGKARRTPDVLSLRGLTNSTKLSAALRTLIAYKERAYISRSFPSTTADIIDALEAHPNMTKSVALSYSGMPRSLPHASIAVVHYLAMYFAGQRDKADEMISVFRTGVPSYPDDPIHVLRERFIRHADSGSRIKQEVATHTLNYAWNMFVRGDTRNLIKFQKDFVDIDGVDRNRL